jgi:hypothetical protein
MKYKHLLLFTILWSGALTAVAQSDSIVGTWALTAADKLLPDGTRVHDHFEVYAPSLCAKVYAPDGTGTLRK